MDAVIAVWIREVDIAPREDNLILFLAGTILLHDDGVIQRLSLVVAQNAGAVPHLEHTLDNRHAVVLCRILAVVGEDDDVHLLQPHSLDRSAETVKFCQLNVPGLSAHHIVGEQLQEAIRHAHSLCRSSKQRVIRFELVRRLGTAELHQTQQAESTLLERYLTLQTFADIIHNILGVHLRHFRIEMAQFQVEIDIFLMVANTKMPAEVSTQHI